MQSILYYLTLPIIYFISYLPFWLLYRLSDLSFIIVYYIIGYRKNVVFTNLKNSFPEKSEHELHTIQYQFYRYFCDLILETVKTLTITPETLQKRLSFTDLEIFQKYYHQHQSIIIVMGHWGNWELGGARFALEPLHKLYVIYHPLHNPYFDKLVYHMRTRLGNGLYAMKDTFRRMIQDQSALTATAFIADQTPFPKSAHWTQFLNQDTPFFTGTGKIAHKINYPVVYVSIKRVKRGYYEIFAEDLVTNPSEVTYKDIVERFSQRLERDINDDPSIWLWTHRRWKHKRNK